jgi:enamidase
MKHVSSLIAACCFCATAASARAADNSYVAYAQPVIAFTHATVVDGSGGKPAYDQTLVIDKGRIVALGDAPRIKIPAGATLIDAHGKTLLPGFVMMHEHLFYPTGSRAYTEMVVSFPPLYLAGGTTTIRTAGTMMAYADLNLRKDIASGKLAGPDIDVTGPYLNGPGLPIAGVHALADADDAERTVDYWADEGVTSFKAYIDITRD